MVGDRFPGLSLPLAPADSGPEHLFPVVQPGMVRVPRYHRSPEQVLFTGSGVASRCVAVKGGVLPLSISGYTDRSSWQSIRPAGIRCPEYLSSKDLPSGYYLRRVLQHQPGTSICDFLVDNDPIIHLPGTPWTGQ